MVAPPFGPRDRSQAVVIVVSIGKDRPFGIDHLGAISGKIIFVLHALGEARADKRHSDFTDSSQIVVLVAHQRRAVGDGLQETRGQICARDDDRLGRALVLFLDEPAHDVVGVGRDLAVRVGIGRHRPSNHTFT